MYVCMYVCMYVSELGILSFSVIFRVYYDQFPRQKKNFRGKKSLRQKKKKFIKMHILKRVVPIPDELVSLKVHIQMIKFHCKLCMYSISISLS
jgi:hypothetical protein